MAPDVPKVIQPESAESPPSPEGLVELTTAELIQLAAVDSVLFNKTFFPNTARLPAPMMHQQIDAVLDSPARYINIMMSRGWAKTSKLRMYTGKRIAYNISRTILFVSASERHSRRSLRWIMNQVERNKRYAQTFGLRPGTPWTPEEMQIIHGVDEQAITVIGLGITGSVRGVNIDDYRPDLIVLDDIMNDELGDSKRQLDKLAIRVLGAVKESLAPATEAPLAKLVMINTPQDFNDITQEAARDTQFITRRFGCWTPESEDRPLVDRESAWPELVPTATLIEDYRAALARNRLSIFVREKECRLVALEEACFKPDWIQYFGEGCPEPEPPLHEMYVVLVIDPVPPPSDAELERGLIDKDFEAIVAVGKWKGKIYVLETSVSRGHDPNWTIGEFFRMMMRWKAKKCIVEVTAYQKTLEWLLRQKMKEYRVYYLVQPYTDNKRKKHQRIIDGLTGVLSNKVIYYRSDQAELVEQTTRYSQTRKIAKDDVIEAVAIAVSDLSNAGDFAGLDATTLDESEYKDLSDQYGGCP